MRYILLIFILGSVHCATAQSVQSIHYHLYTDSLKKGTHNYINIDGKMSDGSWKPLTAKEVELQSDYGKFEGSDLILPENTNVKKVLVTATLKSDKQKTKQITIWIKQMPDPPLHKNDKDLKPRRSNRYY